MLISNNWWVSSSTLSTPTKKSSSENSFLTHLMLSIKSDINPSLIQTSLEMNQTSKSKSFQIKPPTPLLLEILVLVWLSNNLLPTSVLLPSLVLKPSWKPFLKVLIFPWSVNSVSVSIQLSSLPIKSLSFLNLPNKINNTDGNPLQVELSQSVKMMDQLWEEDLKLSLTSNPTTLNSSKKENWKIWLKNIPNSLDSQFIFKLKRPLKNKFQMMKTKKKRRMMLKLKKMKRRTRRKRK